MSYLMIDQSRVTPGNPFYYICAVFKECENMFIFNEILQIEILFSYLFCNVVRNIDKRNNQWTVPEWNQPNMPALGPGETLSKRAGKKIKQR